MIIIPAMMMRAMTVAARRTMSAPKMVSRKMHTATITVFTV